MYGSDLNSCSQLPSSSERGGVDVPQELPDLCTDQMWEELESVFSGIGFEHEQQHPTCSLVQEREDREIVPTQLDYGYDLERRKEDDELAKVDVPQELPDLFTDLMWEDIGSVINGIGFEHEQQHPTCRLVQEREDREIVPTQLDCGYNLERRKEDDEFAKVDVSQELPELFSAHIWEYIDSIIKDIQPKQQHPRCRLVHKRKYRGTVPTQLYCLERRKEDDEFAKPKTYRCHYCPSDMFSVHVFRHHLKRHREAELQHQLSRCLRCGALFANDIETKWHQLKCLRRAIVSNL